MLTVPIAATEIAGVGLLAALAFVLLGYGGETWVRRWRLGPEADGPTSPAASTPAPGHAFGNVALPVAASRRLPSPVLEMLRIGLGFVWLANLLFIVLPASGYWSSFATVARSYGPSTLGGAGLANFVAAHASFFSVLLALVTAYLAVALILGVTTRFALALGAVTSSLLLLTQFGSTFVFPGGTDVGPQPLYLLLYAALGYGGAGRIWALDAWLWARGWGRRVPLAPWFAAPAPPGVTA